VRARAEGIRSWNMEVRVSMCMSLSSTLVIKRYGSSGLRTSLTTTKSSSVATRAKVAHG
jgi:hypothetical protein